MSNKDDEKKINNIKCLIVCGGSIDREFGREMIMTQGFDMIVAADRGLDFLYQEHVTPDVIVGDFDSTETDALDYYKDLGQSEIITLNPMKDDTDSEHALRIAMERKASEIVIVGATGSRLDHVFGNISLLGIGMNEGIDVQIVDPNNKIRMINKPTVIRKDNQHGKYVSLIPLKDGSKASLRGFKYELKDYTFSGFNTLGISNEIEKEEGEIYIQDGVFILVESRD